VHSSALAVWAIGTFSVLLVWTRCANLGASFWLDEAYSALHYIDRGPRGIFFDHYLPNNHVLFNLLAWVTTSRVGHFEAAYRLWSVGPALAAVGIIGWWTWRRVGPWAAFAVVALATVAPLHLELSAQARGYGLAFLAAVCMLTSAADLSSRGRRRDSAAFIASALIGIWTLPVFAIAFVGHVAVLALRRDRRRFAVIATAVVAGGSLVFYAPLLGGIIANSRQTFGMRLPWYGWLSGPWEHLARPTLAAFVSRNPGSPTTNPMLLAAFVALAALAVRRCRRLNERDLLLHLVMPVLTTYVVLDIARIYVADRFVSYLLFYVLVLISLGLTEASHLLSAVAATRLIVIVVLSLLLVVGADHVLAETHADAVLPIENFKLVAQIVNATGRQTPVFTNSVFPDGLRWYLGTSRVQELPVAALTRALCNTSHEEVFVDHHFHSPPEPNLACLRRRGIVPLHISQRGRGSLDVWVIPAGSAPPA
jgi:hypothetical protein